MDDLTIGDVMSAYADDAVDLALDRFDTELDFSVESIMLLDAILDHHHRALSTQHPTEDQVVTMIKIWGGYLGEAIRRRWGGEWRGEGVDDPGAVTLSVQGVDLFPLDRVRKRIYDGAEANVWHYTVALAEHLGDDVETGEEQG